MPRDARRHLLTQLLNAGSVRTQEELATALADAGEAATQATVSRDLAAIGAVRGPGGYSLPGGFTLRPLCLGPFGNRTATPPLHAHDCGDHGGVAPPGARFAAGQQARRHAPRRHGWLHRR